MKIRRATERDIPLLADLFTASVHGLAAGSYDKAQLDAWAPVPPDLEQWRARLASLETLVAEREGYPAGFIAFRNDGYIALLYTAPAHARSGVATALYGEAVSLLRGRGVRTLFTEASIEAQPFFERMGFRLVEEQRVERNGVRLIRFLMRTEDARPPAREPARRGIRHVMDSALETPPVGYARAAGFLYLVIIACGVFSEVVVRSSLIVAGDAAATATNVATSAGLFRIGFAADVLMLLSDVAIAVLFYLLLRPVSRTLALVAAAFRLTQAAVLGFNLLNYYAALLLLSGEVYVAAFAPKQLDALAMLFLDLHRHGYDLGLIFFGVSSLVLGHLIARSRYIPALLGYGIMAAGTVYLAGSFALFLAPASVPVVAPLYVVPLLAEVSLCLWLLVKGVRPRP